MSDMRFEYDSGDVLYYLNEQAKIIRAIALQMEEMDSKLDTMQKEIENMKIKWEK